MIHDDFVTLWFKYIFSAGAISTAEATVATFKVGCSDETTARINKISDLLAHPTMRHCPQEIKEDSDALIPCDWRSCVDMMMPYMKAVHRVGSCP